MVCVVRVTRAFLPPLHQAEEGWLVNISGLIGLIAAPCHTAYAASKFAVRGFSHALRYELEGAGIGVTVVIPGGQPLLLPGMRGCRKEP